MPVYKKIRAVTLPTLSLKDKGTIAHVLFTSAFVLGKAMADAEKKFDKNGKEIAVETKAAAHVANVVDLDTGEEMQIVGAKVLRGNFEQHYPEGAYVNRCFEIENLGKHKGGKSVEGYNMFRIVEVENPGVKTPTAPAPKKK